MQALAFGSDRRFALRERPTPEPDAGEALLRVHYSGICGTDLHAQSLGHYSADVVIGHEFAGEVAAVGPGVPGWQIGDRVAVHPRGNACGECAECRAGWVNLCGDWDTLAPPGSARDGGMAAYAALPATMLRRLPDEVSMLEGAWVEPLAVALRGVSRSGFSVGRRAAVIGAGPIGLLTTLLLRYGGASHIVVLEPSEQRRSKALELGADAAIDPLADDPAAIFGGDLPLVDFTLECSGARAALDTAADIARPHGRITLVGVATGAVEFHSHRAINKELTICSSASAVEEFEIAISLLARKEFDVGALTSDILPLDRFAEAFRRLNDGSAVKILMRPGE